MNVALLKDYLQGDCGIPLEDRCGCPIEDGFLITQLAAARQYFQRSFGILFSPHTVLMGGVGDDKIPVGKIPDPTLPQITKPAIDYKQNDFHGDKWASMKIPFKPIDEVFHVSISYGGKSVSLFDFDEQWWQVSDNRNILRLFPGFLSRVDANINTYVVSSYFLSLLSSHRRIPQAWKIGYTAGYKTFDITAAVGIINNPIIITTAVEHPYVDGDVIAIEGVQGIGGANGVFCASVVDSTNISLDGSVSDGGTYTAGTGQVLDIYRVAPDLAEAVLKKAAIFLLPHLAMLRNQGVQSESVGIDGLSQSLSYVSGSEKTGNHIYAGLQTSLQAQLDEFLDSYFMRRGIRLITTT